MPDFNLQIIIPEMFLFLFALFLIAFDLGSNRRHTKLLCWMAMGGVAVTAVLLYLFHGGISFNNMFLSDSLSVFFKMIFLGAAFMAIGSSFEILSSKINNHRGEFLGLVLISTVGMMFLSSAGELISLYIGLELTTIPLFILVAFFKDDRVSVESGLKYLIAGAFSSGILLYGLSLLYGLAGTTDILGFKIGLSLYYLSMDGNIGGGLILAMFMILGGIGFKLALVPFHMWAPDVYQGAPTPITALLSVGSKAAGVIAFMRIFNNGLYAFGDEVMAPWDWAMVTAVLAAAAMIIGNTTALWQKNIKRMLAYSSIAQIGYVMIGLVAISDLGIASVGFYMFTYMFANMGAFAIVAYVTDKTGSEEIASYKGLARTSPMIAACMSIFMLSLAGIPPLAGFAAKYMIFAAGVESGYLYLVIIAILTTVIALYYYANVIKMMYFAPTESAYTIIPTFPIALVLLIGVIGLLAFGIFPGPIIDFALDTAAVFAF